MGTRNSRLEITRFRAGNWWFWTRKLNPLRVALNFLACTTAMVIPFPCVKNSILRITGMKVGKNAFIALGVALDIFYPERIEIGENAIIGYGCVVTAHEMVQGEVRIGDVKIGARTVIGTRSVVLPGVHIGDGANRCDEPCELRCACEIVLCWSSHKEDTVKKCGIAYA